MKLLSKNIVWAIGALLVATLLFSAVFETSNSPTPLTIDGLAKKIIAGEVQKIVVRGNELLVDLKDGGKGLARKENEAGFTETLKNYGVSGEALQGVAFEIKDESGFRFWLGVLVPTILPLIVIIAVFWFVFRQAKAGSSQAFNFGRSNLRLFGSFKEKISFKDVAGLHEAKQELEEVVDFLKHPKKFSDMGARIPRGVLLMGSPGTGKTLLARAVAGESGVPFFHISASEFVEMFVGVGAARTRDAFATAKKAAPAILFVDEIDAVGRERGTGLGGGHDEREQTLNQILVEMDGFDRETQVIVLAATNRPDVLDPALLRPGRFDRRVFLDLPDIKDRKDILAIHAKNKPMAEDVNLERIAVRTPGFSGADLANIVNEAAIFAARHDRKKILQADLYESIEKVLLGPERRNRVIVEQEKKITAFHEAGHALVASSLKDADPVHKVSIIARGRAGGYTLKLPIEENRLKTKSQFLADLAVMLGGYVAEQEVFNELTTGASSDLKQASELSRRLVTHYGMSELGPIVFGTGEDAVFLGRELGSHRNYSEEMAAKIDQAVSAFIQAAQQNAKKIISSRRKILDAIAKTLLEKETLEQDEFKTLVDSFKVKPVAFQM